MAPFMFSKILLTQWSIQSVATPRKGYKRGDFQYKQEDGFQSVDKLKMIFTNRHGNLTINFNLIFCHRKF